MDLDGDGHNDLLSGSYSRMESSMAGLFQVLWGKGDGSFKKAAVLNGTDDKPLIIPIKGEEQQVENICTRPSAVDWDGDGDLDLVVGNFAGSFYLFAGEGKAKFNPTPQLIMAGDGGLKIAGAHSDPFPVDWDGDGDIDLLSGSSNGGVQWAENAAGKGKPPALNAFQTLIDPWRAVEYGHILNEDDLAGPTNSTRIWVDDVNTDGKLDILVGDSVSLVSPASGISKEDFAKKSAEWKATLSKLLVDLNAATNADERTKISQRYTDHYNKRAQFVREERTGFVWLYLQK